MFAQTASRLTRETLSRGAGRVHRQRGRGGCSVNPLFVPGKIADRLALSSANDLGPLAGIVRVRTSSAKEDKMQMYLGRYAGVAFALLRVVAGLLFAQHGAQKLFGALGGHQVPLASQMGVAGVIEFFGGLLIAIGLFTSWAAFVASGEMAVAYFTAHAKESFWPILNKGELSVVYCFLFLYIACHGGGRYTVGSGKSA
jgi:putative oxidoreductase